MKHDWQRLPDTLEKTNKHGWEPMRRCKNCGIVQQRYAEHEWMRVIGYKWLPKARRCKGTINK